MFGVINRAANYETREDILHSDSRGVIATVKGFTLLDAGFFYQMNIVENTNRTADEIETNASWSFEDRFFRPLTPESIARQLREMQTRWYNPDDREFDLEDMYEQWLMEGLITSIESGGLTLK
jgi:hypothetical protein